MSGRDQEPHDVKGDPPLRAPACLASRLSVVFCVAALVVTFIRLIEFDAPLTRFVRSLNEFQIDYLHNPWLRSLSDIGNQVGRGDQQCVKASGGPGAAEIHACGHLRVCSASR